MPAIPVIFYWLVGGSAAALAGGYFVKSTGEAADETANAALKLAAAVAVAGLALWAAKKARVL